MSNNQINIVLICDDNYAMPTTVTIQSIKENARGNFKYKVYVLSNSLSQKNISVFNKMSSYNFIVKCVLVEERFEVSQYTYVSSTALLKFSIAEIFKKIDKILYLDSDLIVFGDVAELYSIELGDNYIAAVRDMAVSFSDDVNFEYKTNKSSFYFNSGVMLMNAKKLRNDHIKDLLILEKTIENNQRKMESKTNKERLMDQDVLNKVLSYKALEIDFRFNFFTPWIKKINIEDINKYSLKKYNSNQEFINDLMILHYVSKEKPWKYHPVEMYEAWDKYYSALYNKRLDRYYYGTNYFKKIYFRMKIDGIKKTFIWFFKKIKIN